MTIITMNEQGFSDVSEWLTYVDKAYNIHVRAGWEFVDTLRDGIDQFGGKNRHAVAELYELASQQIGLSIGTLQNYISIARAFPVGKRVGELGIAHHMAVRGLPDGLQESLLDNAVSNGLSAESLRYEARKHMPNFANIDISETSNNSHYTNGTNGHSAPVDEYEQQADELAGDESGYDWTEDDEPAPTHVEEPAAALDSNEWYTPVEYIEAARRVMGSIDLDPASNDEAQGFIKAETYHTKETNGLVQEWYGNVWLNPPYADPLPWVAKLLDAFQSGEINQAILLVNTANSPEWSRLLWNSEHTVCLLSKRVRFWRPDRADAKGTAQDQMLWYLGDDASTFKAEFAAYGAIR